MAGEVAGSGDSPDPDPLQDSFFFLRILQTLFFFFAFHSLFKQFEMKNSRRDLSPALASMKEAQVGFKDSLRGDSLRRNPAEC